MINKGVGEYFHLHVIMNEKCVNVLSNQTLECKTQVGKISPKGAEEREF